MKGWILARKNEWINELYININVQERYKNELIYIYINEWKGKMNECMNELYIIMNEVLCDYVNSSTVINLLALRFWKFDILKTEGSIKLSSLIFIF